MPDKSHAEESPSNLVSGDPQETGNKDTNHTSTRHINLNKPMSQLDKLTSYEREEIKPTNKRYLILLIFCLHSMTNAAQWIYLSSITNIVTKYYQVDNMAVNWTSMIYMLVYIPLIVPASWLFEKIGIRNSVLIGSVGTTLGSLVKCFSCQQDRFYLLMLGQTLVAICQLFVLSVPPRLAAVWFPDDQVSLANACGVFGNQLGIALGFVIPPLVMGGAHALDHIETSLYYLFAAIALMSSLISLIIFLQFDESPKRPPGIARLQQMKQENLAAGSGNTLLVMDESKAPKFGPFATVLWKLMTDTNFVLLMISYGLNVGVFYAISTVLNQMIFSLGLPNSSSIVGTLGLLMIISGMVGSVVAGYVLDKTHMYRLVNNGLYLLTLISLVMFALTLESHNLMALYFTVTILGYFMAGYLLIGFEMSNEITWPLPESVSAGLLNLSAQVFGVILTYLGSSIVDRYGNFPTNSFFSLSILIGLIVTLTIKAQMKRQNAVEI